MRIKYIGLYVMAILVLTLVGGGAISAASSKFAAKVNGVGIKTVTLETALNNFIKNQKYLGVDIKQEDGTKLQKDVLEELISAELLYQRSKKAGLGDLTKEIDNQFENIKKTFDSEEEFNKLLKDKGITVKELKEDIRRGVYIKTFLDTQVYNNISVTEDEKKELYEGNKDKLNAPEQVNASHILVRVKQDASDEDKKDARIKIDELRKRAISGEDFAALAKDNSEDNTASRGGVLGYFRKGLMVEPFEDVAFSLKDGEISEVVETQFGYHIIKLLDRKPAHALTYEEVKEDIEKFLLERHKGVELDKLVDTLRESAKIERY